jgi:hypothetical protein
MPIKRRRLKNRREALSRSVAHYLLNGTYPERGQFETWLDVFLLTKRQAYARWLEHRVDLLAEWTDEHPGTRPWAFWYCEAEEPRRVTEHAELLMPVRPGSTDWKFHWQQHFGVPAFQQCRPREFVGFPTVEAQAIYLDRLGLLTDDERAALPPDAEEPEAIDPFLTYEGELEEAIAEGNARRAVEALTRDVSRNGHASHTTHEERDD